MDVVKAGEKTPDRKRKPKKVVVPKKTLQPTVPDPSSVDPDVSRYYNNNNRGCRVVRVKATFFLAF